MALAPGRREDELAAACAAFAERPCNVPVIKPIVDVIEGFIALVPAVPSVELEALAAACVREFDAFRAPLSEEDRVRRNPAKLTPRQREYLDRWGYPYVFEKFRFHMTLTGRLDAGRRAPILEMLHSRFRDTGVNDLVVDRLRYFVRTTRTSVFGSLAIGRFRTRICFRRPQNKLGRRRQAASGLFGHNMVREIVQRNIKPRADTAHNSANWFRGPRPHEIFDVLNEAISKLSRKTIATELVQHRPHHRMEVTHVGREVYADAGDADPRSKSGLLRRWQPAHGEFVTSCASKAFDRTEALTEMAITDRRHDDERLRRFLRSYA